MPPDCTPLQTPGPLAVIDLGAHSARLEIAQILPDGQIEEIQHLTQPIRLGAEVFVDGRIHSANVKLVAKILADFSTVMAECRVQRYKAIATSAVREATNREIFLSRVERLTGIQLDILEAPEEARLIYLALKEALAGELGPGIGNALICVIGTGASLLMHVRDGRLQCAESVRLGTIRMIEELAGSVTPGHAREVLDPFISTMIDWSGRFSAVTQSDRLIAIGSTVRSLARFSGHKPRSRHAEITRDDLRVIATRTAGKAATDIAAEWQLSDTLAESVQPCCVMLENLIDIVATDRVLVPMVNTRDAVLSDLIREVRGESDPFEPEIISAAEHLGRKYHYDQDHARAVANVAVRLFDELQELHELPPRARLLLEVAAILHDIGFFISNQEHHKHSFYLIAHSELPGITPEEKRILSVVGRYHRRSMPKASHTEYTSLSPENRLLVSKLAAILRVADSLDRSHTGRLRGLKIQVEDERLVLFSPAFRDLGLERWGLSRKADMFEDVFGLRVVMMGQQ